MENERQEDEEVKTKSKKRQGESVRKTSDQALLGQIDRTCTCIDVNASRIEVEEKRKRRRPGQLYGAQQPFRSSELQSAKAQHD